jgi:hypothetical protein
MEKNVKNFGIVRTGILRMISLTVILAFILPAMTNAQGGKANFAGTWAINAAKSTPAPTGGGGGGGAGGGGGRGGMGGGTNFVATMDATSLSVTTTRVGQDGTSTTRVSKYVLDGKENTLAPPAGGGGGGGGGNATPQKYTATWSTDGKTLTIVTTRTTQNGDMKSSDIWTLTDANTLSRTSISNFNGTENKRVNIYDKK